VQAARPAGHRHAQLLRARRGALSRHRLAREAAEAGGAAPAVLNAANEVAVAAFLKGQIRFTQISAIVARTMDSLALPAPASLAEVLAVDAEARQRAMNLLEPA
jgi:1-deoxy-D-xylulose-5-phosphate reductoisomerase